ncbi:hypothetical protein N7512_000665 [Penicillium capsulatum]|nr:hypothetical protein N7512_000665 [Penicillium capsulatum]
MSMQSCDAKWPAQPGFFMGKATPSPSSPPTLTWSGVGRSKISDILVGLRSLGTHLVGMIHFPTLTACRSAAGDFNEEIGYGMILVQIRYRDTFLSSDPPGDKSTALRSRGPGSTVNQRTQPFGKAECEWYENAEKISNPKFLVVVGRGVDSSFRGQVSCVHFQSVGNAQDYFQ